MVSSIGAMVGLNRNGFMRTPGLAPLRGSTFSPIFPHDIGVDDVTASNGLPHPDDIDESPSSNFKGNPPPSALSPAFFRTRAAPLEALAAEPTTDEEESDSDETVVETEDESASPKTFIPRGFGIFFQIMWSRSHSTARRTPSQLGPGRSLDGRGVRLLPSDGERTASSPLQRRISVLEDVVDESERHLAVVKQKDVELAQLRDALKQREVDYSDLQKIVAGKEASIVALQERLDREENQRCKLRRRFQIFRSASLPQWPSDMQRNVLRIQLDRQLASKQPLDMPTREWYEHEIARLKDRLAECNSRLDAGGRSPGSEGTSPVHSPTDSRHLPMKGNRKVRAPGMRSSVSI